jgi:hypothetical protein
MITAQNGGNNDRLWWKQSSFFPIMINFSRYLPIFLATLACPPLILAHPLDEYVQATLVAIEPGEIRLQMNLTPGVAVAEQVLGLIDLNHDGIISSNESAAYAESVKRDLVVRLDGRNVEAKLTALNFPDPVEMRTGWGIIQLEYSVTPGALVAGQHSFTLDNRHHPVASAYLFNAAHPGSESIQITGQGRNENQSMGEIAFYFQPVSTPLITIGIIASLAALFVVCVAGGWQTKRKRNTAAQRNQACAFSLSRTNLKGA